MTLEDYLEIQKMSEIPMTTWFEYYQEKGGVLPYNDFVHYFTTILANNSMIRSPAYGIVQVTFTTALNRFYHYYNKKFGLNERFATE